MQLEKIAITKRTPVSLLMRTIVETYLKYMNRAFMHPGENDVMQRILKLEDRLVRLSIKDSMQQMSGCPRKHFG